MPPGRRNRAKDSLAGTASERVRAIIEAAESSAAEIRAEAEGEAERIRARAEERARALRSEVRGDVQALMGSIRAAVDRLSADLERLEERLGEPETAPAPTSPASAATPTAKAATAPAAAPTTPAPTARAAPGRAAIPEPELEPDIALAEDAAVAPAEPEQSREDATAEPDSSARLVALNMALDGVSREEVDVYLRENFQLRDRAALLDEIYASLGR